MNNGSNNTVTLTLELIGGSRTATAALAGAITSSDSDVRGDSYQYSSLVPECRRVPTPEGLKLQVWLPRMVDAGLATTAADLLLQGIENISSNVKVERVEILHLRFTPDGVGALMQFLAIQANDVKHLLIHNIVGDNNNNSKLTATTTRREDEQAMSCLALAFQESALETLDLGYNVLGPYIWPAFQTQNQLQTLLLEHVEMNDESLSSMVETMQREMDTRSLTKLCLSNKISTTTEFSVQCSSNILNRCTNLRSLRWLNRGVVTNRSRLPCQGVCDLAQRMIRSNSYLKHLELEGGNLTDEDFDDRGICGALKLLHRLNHLKLRNMRLSKSRMTKLVSAFKTGRVPLRNLDLSKNKLGDAGVAVLSEIADIRILMTNLKYLNIEHNDIGNSGAIVLFSALGAQGRDDIDIRATDGNRVDLVKVALGIATKKAAVERERDTIKLERDKIRKDGQRRDNLSFGSISVGSDGSSSRGEMENIRQLSQRSLSPDVRALQQEVEKLTAERDSLVKAFSVMGAMKHVEEHNSVLSRLSRLEEAVHGQRSISRNNSARGGRGRPVYQRAQSEMMLDTKSGRPGNLASPLGSFARRPTRAKSGSLEKLSLQPIHQEEDVPSKDELRARVLADVASLQSKKDEVRARILNDVATLQAQRRVDASGTSVDVVNLQAKLQEKVANKEHDRARVLDDVARLRQEKARAKARDANRAGVDMVRSGRAALTRPDSLRSLVSSESGGSGGSGRLTRTSQESPSQVSQSTSERFQRLLHKQIQNQLFDSSNRVPDDRVVRGNGSSSNGGGNSGSTAPKRGVPFRLGSSSRSLDREISIHSNASISSKGSGRSTTDSRMRNGDLPKRALSLRSLLSQGGRNDSNHSLLSAENQEQQQQPQHQILLQQQHQQEELQEGLHEEEQEEHEEEDEEHHEQEQQQQQHEEDEQDVQHEEEHEEYHEEEHDEDHEEETNSVPEQQQQQHQPEHKNNNKSQPKQQQQQRLTKQQQQRLRLQKQMDKHKQKQEAARLKLSSKDSSEKGSWFTLEDNENSRLSPAFFKRGKNTKKSSSRNMAAGSPKGGSRRDKVSRSASIKSLETNWEMT